MTLRPTVGRISLRRKRSQPPPAAPLGVRRGEAFEHVVTVAVPPDTARETWRRLYPEAPDNSGAPVTEALDGSLSWRYVRANRPHAAGKLVFEPMSHGRGTVVRLLFAGRPPGRARRILRRVTPGAPWRELRRALLRMKHVAETGETPTTHNQPTGEGRVP